VSRSLTRTQLAKALGVAARTVTRWVELGCPHARVKGRLMFDEGEVRAWCAQGGLDLPGAATPPSRAASVAAPRGPAATADLVRKLAQAKRSELELAAERGLRDLGLDERIRACKTFEEFAAIDLEVAALLANGTLSPDRARAIQGSIAGARQNTKAHHDADDGLDRERFVLASEDALKIAEAFEGIVSDERRARIVAHVLAEAAVDLAEHPNVDLADGVPEEPETQTGDEEPE
jgi:hypothetical protein